jgi:hypothetical protein
VRATMICSDFIGKGPWSPFESTLDPAGDRRELGAPLGRVKQTWMAGLWGPRSTEEAPRAELDIAKPANHQKT